MNIEQYVHCVYLTHLIGKLMFLRIKNIPKLSWSSKYPNNLKPSFKTLFYLCLGLIFFGFGEGLLIVSSIGASPWNVLHQGIAINLGLSIGTIAFLVSFLVLLLWFFLDQKIGMGTIINFIIIAIMIDVTIYFFEKPEIFFSKFIMIIGGILVIGFGTAMYLIANLGPGPRDGLMTGLQKKNKCTYSTSPCFYRSYCGFTRMVFRWCSRYWNLTICYWHRAFRCFRFAYFLKI